MLKENYVLTNATYLEESAFLTPKFYISQPWRATIRIDNYNLRFSPTIENLKGKDKESFTFGCEYGTNIIGKIKINSSIKVLAEYIEKDRKWLFVEVEKNQLSNPNTALDFDFKNQTLRGWISDKYVKKD